MKGYTHCASAVVSLGRHNEGIEIYRDVLKDLDPNNKIIECGLEDCEKKLIEKGKENQS